MKNIKYGSYLNDEEIERNLSRFIFLFLVFCGGNVVVCKC